MDEQVKRWDENHYPGQPMITGHDNGRYVLYTDYTALLAERDRMKAIIDRITNRNIHYHPFLKCWFNGEDATQHPSRASAVAALLESTT